MGTGRAPPDSNTRPKKIEHKLVQSLSSPLPPRSIFCKEHYVVHKDLSFSTTIKSSWDFSKALNKHHMLFLIYFKQTPHVYIIIIQTDKSSSLSLAPAKGKLKMKVTNRYIAIKTHFEGKLTKSDFEIKSSTISTSVQPGSNDIVLKNLYVLINPYQINCIKRQSSSQNTSSYAVVVNPDEVSRRKNPWP